MVEESLYYRRRKVDGVFNNQRRRIDFETHNHLINGHRLNSQKSTTNALDSCPLQWLGIRIHVALRYDVSKCISYICAKGIIKYHKAGQLREAGRHCNGEGLYPQANLFLSCSCSSCLAPASHTRACSQLLPHLHSTWGSLGCSGPLPLEHLTPYQPLYA